MLSAAVLAGVTGWLAYLTKVVSEGALESAKQSRIAAEATLLSVAVAETSVDVRFDVEPEFPRRLEITPDLFREAEEKGIHLRGPDGSISLPQDAFEKLVPPPVWESVTLTCTGVTVVVHGLRVTSVGVRAIRGGGKVQGVPPEGMELAPTETLPRQCQAGETVEFAVNERPYDGELDLASFDATVSYSFGPGPLRTRNVSWKETPHPDESIAVANPVEELEAERTAEPVDSRPGGRVGAVPIDVPGDADGAVPE